jgi:hypothetical protein
MHRMDYLQRYVSGDRQAVWDDLRALGAAVRQEPHAHVAEAVARETMRRVRRNCQRIVDRLAVSGYEFGVYPDGSTGYYTLGALVAPTPAFASDRSRIEGAIGQLPLSLTAFWEEVGSVDLVGRRQGWPELLDPLVVYPPEAISSDLDSMEVDEHGEFRPPAIFEGGLAPDYLHKDNISGGAPYAVELPNAGVDFLLLNERHALFFVDYLRFAILRWGGLPGLDDRGLKFEPLAHLIAGLEPF